MMDKNLRKIVSEEVSKFIKENKETREETREAAIASALSFMQDVQGSVHKLSQQKELNNTNSEVDNHLQESINHANEAIQSYLDGLSLSIKSDVVSRIGEIKIDE